MLEHNEMLRTNYRRFIEIKHAERGKKADSVRDRGVREMRLAEASAAAAWRQWFRSKEGLGPSC